jgi:mitosis inhibitor protein kinase SWE1
MRHPGTPQKRVKTAVALGGTRPWQSAVASKIDFDFGNEEDEDDNEEGWAKGQAVRPRGRRHTTGSLDAVSGHDIHVRDISDPMS